MYFSNFSLKREKAKNFPTASPQKFIFKKGGYYLQQLGLFISRNQVIGLRELKCERYSIWHKINGFASDDFQFMFGYYFNIFAVNDIIHTNMCWKSCNV